MGSGGVAIAALPTVICFKVTFSDGLGGGNLSPVSHRMPFLAKKATANILAGWR